MSSDTLYRLVYFNIRGLAEPIRWMFRMKNVAFVDERIELDNWKEEKARFGKQLCQLPFLYLDDKTELIQVHTVMRYVAKQLGFNGQNEMETARADEVSELVYDLRLNVVDMLNRFTPENPDIVRHTIFRDFRNETSLSKKVVLKKHLMGILPGYLDKFSNMLEDSGGQYLAGENLTYADLVVANFLDICEDNINPDILEDYPTLKGLLQEIFEIPEIAKFVDETKAIYASPA